MRAKAASSAREGESDTGSELVEDEDKDSQGRPGRARRQVTPSRL